MSPLCCGLFSDPQNPQISDPADWSGLSPPVRPPTVVLRFAKISEDAPPCTVVEH